MSSFLLIITAFGLMGQDTIISPESADRDQGNSSVMTTAVFNQETKRENSIQGAKNRFVFGFGVGGGLSLMKYHGYEGDPTGFGRKTGVEPCLSTNFRIGFAPSERFFICWNSRTNWFKPIINEPYSGSSYFIGGGAGIGVTFFPFPERKNIYLDVMFGYSNLGKGFKLDVNSFGTELAVGAGYCIMKRLSLELTLQAGSTDKGYYSGSIMNPAIFNFTINYIIWRN